MKKLEDMTPDELRAYADEKEEEDKYKTIKTAVVAEDVYIIFDFKDLSCYVSNILGEPLNENQIDEILSKMKSGCKVASAGTKCQCYLDDGEEYWYNDTGDLEGWGKEEAEKWFKDIKEVGNDTTVDRTGSLCECGGEYKERQLQDDADGILRCECGNQIKRWE